MQRPSETFSASSSLAGRGLVLNKSVVVIALLVSSKVKEGVAVSYRCVAHSIYFEVRRVEAGIQNT